MFIDEGFVRHATSAVRGAAIYGRYKAWCDRSGLEPVNPTVFKARFQPACASAGLTWAERDGEVLLVGVKAAA